MKDSTLSLRIGCVFALLAVALGAFGAHGLKDLPSERGHSATWETAVRYQMWHALALILIYCLSNKLQPGRRTISLFTTGICLFSGSLYGLSLFEAKWLGPITPLGGLCLLAGWVSLLCTPQRVDPTD